MKKFLITVAVVMTAFTLITMCACGTWSSWYPWPPPADGSAGDVQNAVWETWIWAVLVPTVIIDFLIMRHGNAKGWWKI